MTFMNTILPLQHGQTLPIQRVESLHLLDGVTGLRHQEAEFLYLEELLSVGN